jgi:hypothetical protein
MKTNPEHRPEELLLDALLGDEEWQAASTAIKSRALGTLRARRRARRLARWTLGVAACAAVIAGATHWFGHTAGSPPATVSYPAVPGRESVPRYMTDKELLASFPKGSCFLAEVDGKVELIFVDPNLERKYLVSQESGRQ